MCRRPLCLTLQAAQRRAAKGASAPRLEQAGPGARLRCVSHLYLELLAGALVEAVARAEHAHACTRCAAQKAGVEASAWPDVLAISITTGAPSARLRCCCCRAAARCCCSPKAVPCTVRTRVGAEAAAREDEQASAARDGVDKVIHRHARAAAAAARDARRKVVRKHLKAPRHATRWRDRHEHRAHPASSSALPRSLRFLSCIPGWLGRPSAAGESRRCSLGVAWRHDGHLVVLASLRRVCCWAQAPRAHQGRGVRAPPAFMR